MKKYLLLTVIAIMLVFAAACNGSDTATPEATSVGGEATTAPAPTDEIPEEPLNIAPPEVVPLQQVLSIVWQWSDLVEIEPSSQSVVPNSENYTLVLWHDSSFSFKADCNVGGGSYTADDGGNLTLELGPITLAECGPDSLYDQYLALLEGVSNYGMVDGRLALLSNEGKALMTFNYGGPAEKSEPAPTVCTGIDMQSIKFDTMGLPYAWQANCIPATLYDNTQPPGATGMPEHAQINFGVTDPQDWQMGDPILYIIPVAEYEQLWNENGDPSVSNEIAQLKQLLANKSDPIPSSNMPALPFSTSAEVNDLAVQGEYLDIEMGSGVRYVGRFVQDANPVASDNPPLFYIYQGFTSDGVYLISFFYPVTTETLPSADEVTDEERQQVEEDPVAYLQEKVDELNALSPADWEPMLTTLDGAIKSLEFDYEAPESPPAAPTLTNVNWQWFDLVENDPASQSVIPNPEAYVVIFLNDGTLDLLADCNFGGGTYALDGNNISITVGPITQIECEEGSLSTEFVTLLGNAATYELVANKLNLNQKDDAGRMGFANGGPALLPPIPGEGVPTATTIEPVNVRSGPGTVYLSYGVVPAGTTFEVTGVSEDGTWWVVKIPSDVAANGQGWVSAAYVETENTDEVPIVPAPPLDEEGEIPPGTPTATTTEPINVRSGPGTAYTTYGIAPAGATFVVIGKSADGTWWVAQLPTDIASDGRGWLNARYVEVNNVEDVPVIEAPPLP
ncbi:MAG: META domain-containing protein [Chloroflexota bacterium]|nr:META domain-containing protein [Chloroflexota bacterium]